MICTIMCSWGAPPHSHARQTPVSEALWSLHSGARGRVCAGPGLPPLGLLVAHTAPPSYPPQVFIQRPLAVLPTAYDALRRRLAMPPDAVFLLGEHNCWPWPQPSWFHGLVADVEVFVRTNFFHKKAA